MTNTLVKKDFVEVGLANSITNGDVNVVKDSSVKLYYEIHGNGSNKVLFVMGLNTSLNSWEHQTNYFGTHKDYQICVFDNRGVGWSDAPFGIYSIKQMASDVVILLNKIEWTNNINLVGISMGGMISQELVLLKPHYFRSLCLTSSTSGLTIPPVNCMLTFMKLMTLKNPIAKAQLVVDALYPESWLKSPPPSESSHNTNRDHAIESFIRRMNHTRIQPISGAIGQISACLKHYVSSERLQIIRDNIPKILVVTGSYDNFIRPSNSFYLAEQLNADFEYFEGSGHYIPSELPERYNLLLEDHFKEARLINS